MAYQPAPSAIDRLKDGVRQATLPIARALVAAGVPANALTVAGFLLNVAVAALVLAGAHLAAGLLFLLVNSLDFLDGAVARLSGTSGDFGAFLDSVLDRYSEGVVYLGLVGWSAGQNQPALALLATAALIGSFLVSYTRARAEGLGYHGEVGWAPRPERIVLLGLALIAQSLLAAPVLAAALALIALLTNLTALQRMQHVARQVAARRRSGVPPRQVDQPDARAAGREMPPVDGQRPGGG